MVGQLLTGQKRYLKIPLAIAVVLFIILLVTVLLFAGSSVKWMFNAENRALAGTSLPDYDRMSNEDLYKAEAESLVINNRLALSGTDSVYMVISIPDSSVNIELKGVTLYKARVDITYMSPVIRKIKRKALLSWMSVPWVDVHELSTLDKHPVLIKNAPKDTAEARKQVGPAQPAEEYAALLLEFDNGIILQIRQADSHSSRQHREEQRFKRSVFRQYHLPGFLKALTFRQPDYHPTIILETGRQEVINIYRSIPHEVKATVRL